MSNQPTLDQVVFVIWLDEDWDVPPVGFTRRRMLLALADYCRDRGGQLLCIDRPMPPLVRHFFPGKRFEEPMQIQKGIRRVRENLVLLRPWAPVIERVASLTPLFNIVNAPLLRWQVDRLLAKLRLADRRRIYMIFHPYQASLLATMQDGLKVYECYDEYAPQGEQTGFSNPTRFSAQRIKSMEERVLQSVDIVVATAERLEERCRQVNPRTYLLHNGVDFDRFAQDFTPPPEVARTPKPIVGFAGAFKSVIDIRLITACARRRPHWSFVFLGPEDPGQAFQDSAQVRDARSQPNIHFWGIQPEEDVPRYMSTFDVCIVPYALGSDATVAIYPLKINEYLALGKPVVATDYLQDFSAYRDIVYVAKDTPDDFIQKLEEALLEKDEAIRHQRRALARKNSWLTRAERLCDILLSHL